MKNYLLLTLAAVALCFTACKKNTEEPTPSAPVAVTGVSLDKTMVALEIDESTTVTATVAPENATNKNVEWSVANTAIATVIDGVVTGVAAGETTLTATTADGGFTATIPVKVVTEKVSSITIGAQATKIGIGEVTYLNANLQPEHPDEDGIEWSSSNPGIATVEDSSVKHGAKVTGVAVGKATITATAKDGSGVKGETTVTVVGAMPTALTINGEKTPDPIYTWHGKEVTLDLACTPANADISRLYWDIHTDNYAANADAMKYEFTANTLKLSFEHSQSTSATETIYIRAYDSEETSTYYGGINVAYQTLSWLFDAKHGFNSSSDISSFAGTGDDMKKFNWNKDDYTSGLNFVAYYYTDGLAHNVSPYSEGTQHYYEYYIPSSEYTLTSSDESKIKVTKNDDGISWMIERLNTTDLVAVTLTYKCGDHTQTYTINLIP